MLNVFLGAIILGMSAEVVREYIPIKKNEIAKHVVLISISYCVIIVAQIYANLRFLGQHPETTAVVVPLMCIGEVIGIYALIQILRVVSGRKE